MVFGRWQSAASDKTVRDTVVVEDGASELPAGRLPRMVSWAYTDMSHTDILHQHSSKYVTRTPAEARLRNWYYNANRANNNNNNNNRGRLCMVETENFKCHFYKNFMSCIIHILLTTGDRLSEHMFDM